MGYNIEDFIADFKNNLDSLSMEQLTGSSKQMNCFILNNC